MAGPTQQSVDALVIPPGESLRQYSPNSLAQKVQNLHKSTEDTLKSVIGPCQYIPWPMNDANKSPFDVTVTIDPDPLVEATVNTSMPFEVSTPYSICQASLLNGSANVLYMKAGSVIYRYEGWNSISESYPDATKLLAQEVTGLSDSVNQRFPDQWVVFNDQIIWCNGIDRPRVFSYDGMVTPLGFDQAPGAPLALGPQSADYEDKGDQYPNSLGYSWEGDIGTAGDSLDGEGGAILSGLWYYYAQYEDIHGNRSAFSLPSNAVRTSAQNTDPYVPSKSSYQTGIEFDNLSRQFFVRVPGEGPEHSVAMLLYRTPDTKNVGTEPQLLQRFPGSRHSSYADNIPDSGLGSIWEETVTVPLFKLMCTHQGRLVVANTLGDPGVVRRSQAGFPGTFNKLDFIYPDSGGSEVTGVASHNGLLLAFTETSVYSLEEFGMPRPLTQGIGCVAPKSIKARPDGMLIWLGRDGFYGLREGGQIIRISEPIDKLVTTGLNKSFVSHSVAYVDPETKEYRCAVPKAGSRFNDLVVCFDGEYWRRQELDIHIADVVVTNDFRRYPVALVTDYTAVVSLDSATKGAVIKRLDTREPIEADDILKGYGRGTAAEDYRPTTNILVLDRSHNDGYWEPPKRTIIYRSGWLRGDTHALTPINVRSMYIGMYDAWNGTATIRLFKNGSWSPQKEMSDLLLVGPDNESGMVKDIAGSARIRDPSLYAAEDYPADAARFHDPRLFWRQIPIGFENISTWAFEIEVEHNPFYHKDAASIKGLSNNEITKRESQDIVETAARLHIAGFAFETSVATSGSPRGRIPNRSDR
jgi:hypothetical protein